MILFLCSLCYKQYPENVESCPLQHCNFCGDTNLEVISANIFKDPIFIVINALFAVLIIGSVFNRSYEHILEVIGVGTAMYIFGLGIYLATLDRRSIYNCKNCRTIVKIPLEKATIGKFDEMPTRKEVIQSSIPKTHTIKELIMIFGSIGSVVSFLVILITLEIK